MRSIGWVYISFVLTLVIVHEGTARLKVLSPVREDLVSDGDTSIIVVPFSTF